jgi:hypothetical protein
MATFINVFKIYNNMFIVNFLLVNNQPFFLMFYIYFYQCFEANSI